MTDFLDELKCCKICPRKCGVNRFSDKLGYCKTDAGFNISTICIHRGEEPVISGKKGICNIFFSHCNLQCIYCQNIQISDNKKTIFQKLSLKQIIDNIIEILDQGIKTVGFVSASHNIPQIKTIIKILQKTGRKPIFVYNTNGYDLVESIKSLEGLIDVYLPDFKYIDSSIAKQYSDADNYPETAKKAVKEMFRQKGSSLLMDDDIYAKSGLIIRHLVLPNHIDQSIEILEYIAKELSCKIHISLMSQYYPIKEVRNHKRLNRNLKSKEYDKVVKAFESLGFYNGWVQELDSSSYYLPDFNNNEPFC